MTNNKLREALEKVRELISDEVRWVDDISNQQAIALCVIDDALAEPIRNCDVGTAEEQTARALEYCSQFPSKDGRCVGCPLDDDSNSLTSCMCRWAQMPYEPVKQKKLKQTKENNYEYNNNANVLARNA